MLSKEDDKIINTYVDPDKFDIEALRRYVSRHENIEGDVFAECCPSEADANPYHWPACLPLNNEYLPVDRATFIRRIPFYFYTHPEYNVWGSLSWTLSSIKSELLDPAASLAEKTSLLEKVYGELEFMFYDKGFSLEDIFSYIPSQYGVVSGPFLSWAEYIHLCDELGLDDYFPESFISSYNRALEAVGKSPVIYKINPVLTYSSECFYRRGRVFTFEGTFPVDENGDPVIRWTNLRIENAEEISCTTKQSHDGSLFVTVTPETMIEACDIYGDDANAVYVLYAGPKHLDFDNTALRRLRKSRGYTQKEVADAIGASVRTYQKWESGVTTPDSRYMLRLLNWLDISDPVLLSRVI